MRRGIVWGMIVAGAAMGACESSSDDSGGGTGGDQGDGDDDGTGSANPGDGDGDQGGDGDGGSSGDGDGDGDGSGASNPGDGDGDGSGGGSPGGGRVTGTDSYDCNPPEGEIGTLDVEEVVSGLEELMFVTHAPNDDRLFIVERRGTIQVLSGGNVTEFLDISDRVVSPDDGNGNYERGLFGLAFHPQYSENGLFYVHFSAQGSGDGYTEGDAIIAEYSVSSGDADKGDPTSERLVLTVEQPFPNHNGGTLLFGGDDLLYVGLGDGGNSRDPDNNGQNPNTLLGSLLRIDPTQDGSNPYSSPSDNLSDAADEVWDYGLRNSFRFTVDGCTGDLYIGDVGQNHFEELDIELFGDGHKNYGWPILEGEACTPPDEDASPPDDCGDTSRMSPPAFAYSHDLASGGPAIIGGAVYRGSSVPALRGSTIFADYGFPRFWRARFDRETQTLSDPVNITGQLSIIDTPVAIENGNDGEIYIVDREPGVVYRLIAVP